MSGKKACAIEAHCQARGLAYVSFDYRGCGQSSGHFEDFTLGDWIEDATLILDKIVARPCILVGSSMGGWIMLVLARLRSQEIAGQEIAAQKIAGLIGIAPAPNFTEDLVRPHLSPQALADLKNLGHCLFPDLGKQTSSAEDHRRAIITQAFLEEARQHLLPRSLSIPAPLRLLQGMADQDVPWQNTVDLAERFEGDDVILTLVKDGTHRFSRPSDIARILAAIDELIAEKT